MKSLTLRSIPCPCWRWALQLLSLFIHASLIFAFSSITSDTFHSTRTHGRFKDRSFPTLDHDRFPSKHRAVGLLHVTPNDSDSINNKEEINPVTKASWYAVEWFGKAFGQTTETKASYSGPPQSLTETLQRIQLDNERSYFLSGQVDESIYDPDCVFRDPFVSFAGRDRFVTNLANLGSFISKYDARVLEYNQPNETTIQTKVCSGTRHYHFDATTEELLIYLLLTIMSRRSW